MIHTPIQLEANKNSVLLPVLLYPFTYTKINSHQNHAVKIGQRSYEHNCMPGEYNRLSTYLLLGR